MDQTDLNNLYLSVSSLESETRQGYSDKAWIEKRRKNGLIRLKRKILGRFGRLSIKTIDEISDLLVNLGAADNGSEGLELAREFVGTNDILYDEGHAPKSRQRHIGIEKVRGDTQDQEAYKFIVWRESYIP